MEGRDLGNMHGSTKPKRVYEHVEYEFDGKKHDGRFYVQRGWLTLSTEFGYTSAALNGSPPEVLALILFRDLIADQARASA
jgi:hypothetical protein